MSKKDVEKILVQVKLRYYKASALFLAGELEKADEKISELRYVLDDIYDRQEEEVKKETSEDQQ